MRTAPSPAQKERRHSEAQKNDPRISIFTARYKMRGKLKDTLEPCSCSSFACSGTNTYKFCKDKIVNHDNYPRNELAKSVVFVFIAVGKFLNHLLLVVLQTKITVIPSHKLFSSQVEKPIFLSKKITALLLPLHHRICLRSDITSHKTMSNGLNRFRYI